MCNMTTKMNGYRTPEMIACDIEQHGLFVGCSQLDQFLNKYYIFDAGSFKSGVEVTYLNGKAVATRRIPLDALKVLPTTEVKFGDF